MLMFQAWVNGDCFYYCGNYGIYVGGMIIGIDCVVWDMIGVVFGVFWQGSFILDCVFFVGMVLDVIEIFEWVMDFDGNLAIISDCFDVINNFWSWDYLV